MPSEGIQGTLVTVTMPEPILYSHVAPSPRTRPTIAVTKAMTRAPWALLRGKSINNTTPINEM